MAPQLWQEVKGILDEALKRDEGEPRQICGRRLRPQSNASPGSGDVSQGVRDEKLEACADNLRDTVMSNIWSPWIGRRIGRLSDRA